MQAMALFPDALKKAQEEVDRVVGKDRLPRLDDAPNLPYVWACVKETLRCMLPRDHRAEVTGLICIM